MSKLEVIDSPTDWVNEHIQRYIETDGAVGHDWRGVPALLLTTKGRKSGALRRCALVYGRDGDRVLLVASKGGAPNHPLWYLNLTADPQVEVQIRSDIFTARARTADADERPALWNVMTTVWPGYDGYQARTEREIPIVILERV